MVGKFCLGGSMGCPPVQPISGSNLSHAYIKKKKKIKSNQDRCQIREKKKSEGPTALGYDCF